MTYCLTTLDNCLRVASEHLDGVDTVTVSVAVDVGARYEREGEGGISHLLEHMAFKGTERRSAQQIAEEFDDIGGILNAYTSHEYTVYYAKVLKEDLTKAVDVLGDILQNAVFDEKELAHERSVILQEIAMQQDSPEDLVFTHFHEAAFPGQPLGRPVLGPAERVATYSRQDLTHYLQRHYHPARMVVAAAGNVEQRHLADLVAQHFPMPDGNKGVQADPARYRGTDHREAREFEQLHVLLGVAGVSIHDPDYTATQLLAGILGGSMSSRLFQEVREKRGLAYNVQAFISAYADAGLFGVYAATGEDKAHDLVPVLCDQMMQLTKDVGDDELKRAKNQYKASLLMSRESTSSVSDWIARHLLSYGRYITGSELASRADTVTKDDILRVAQKLFTAPQLTTAALGPIGQLEPHDATRARFN